MKLKDTILEIQELKEENQDLKLENDFLKQELERITNMGMFEFANEFCNDTQLEEAGHEFARELLGGA